MFWLYRVCCATAVATLLPVESFAQSASPLPEVVVQGERARRAPVRRPAPRREPAPAPAPAAPQGAPASLTVPNTEQARTEIERTPGAVEVVADTQFKNTPAQTLKDVLEYVPGVFIQPKWGEDSRLSIRGSGLSRNFHLRGVQLFMDGIPINTADGYGDFQELDPTAYRYVEVYKGANALRFGANALGGAINFVMPTGRDAHLIEGRADAGSFGFRRLQSSSGGVHGPADYFVTGAWTKQDGFRNHSWGEAFRGAANFGYQITPNAETRFYINANDIRQRIPGSVTRTVALNAPRTAAVINVLNDWQRNIDSVRLANKTTMNFGPTKVEAGVFGVDRHLMHPIFQWIDYRYDDYGGFARMVDEHSLLGHDNRLIAGVNVHNGRLDNQQFLNSPGAVKGALVSSSLDKSNNLSAYVENSFFMLPGLALVTGTNYLFATRERDDRFLLNGDQSGRTEFSHFSPKAGVLWNVDPKWQVFGNISRSVEVPSFGESSNFPAPVIPFTSIEEQTATTYEIGTRGSRPNFHWDFTLYRMQINNELQCLYSSFGNCNVVNADRTVHQGVEAGFGVAVLQSLMVKGDLPDRLWLNVAYTYNDFFFNGDPLFGHNQLPGAPRHFLRSELVYKHPAGFYFGPNVEWVPEAYFVDSANTLETEPYAIWGLKAGYEGKHFSGYVEGRNLANTKYIASASIINVANPALPLFEPGTGRGVFAGVRAKW
jgi:iron complex outermembrane receptor protein